MALYAPVTLLVMPLVWLTLITLGYMFLYWAVGVEDFTSAFKLSGSSLLTLGFVDTRGTIQTILAFTEATLGLMLIALLIAYLPTMYSAFSQRESSITLLEIRAGSPPFFVEMFLRFHRLHGLTQLHEVWLEWERWFAHVDETHTSLTTLSFFRSPQPDRSWVTAAGVILDASAMALSTLDIPRDTQSALCLRAGYVALRHICDYFELAYPLDPAPTDPISVTREEYDQACAELEAAGVPLKADREAAWSDFRGWRVNYDAPLLELAALTLAPYAPWSSDRSLSPLGRGDLGRP
jgi:hypothetical protein